MHTNDATAPANSDEHPRAELGRTRANGTLLPRHKNQSPGAHGISSALQPGLFDSEILTRKDVARILKCSVSTLDRMASTGSGPPYHRLGKNSKRGPARYLRGDVEAWLDECRRTSTSTKA